MRADKDDVPDYLKPRKKQVPWRTLAILGVGSAIFWGLVTVFAKPIVIDVAQLKQSIRFGGEPIFSQQPAHPQQPPAEALQGNDQDWIRSSQAQQTIQANRELERRSQDQSQQQRQTSFSDANYAPQGRRNVVPPPPVQRAQVQTPQKKQEIVVIGKADPKLSELCGGREGSIRRRECKSMLNLGERNNSYNGR